MRKWIIIVMLMCNTAKASQNTNLWPSYEHPRKLMDQLNECYTGLVERYIVCGLSPTNVTVPNTNRPNRVTLEGFKADIQVIAPYFWNTNFPISNASDVVYWNPTTLVYAVYAPSNYYSHTFNRGISGIGGYTQDTTVGHGYGFTNEYTVTNQAGVNFPGSRTNWYTTDYGIQPLRDMLEALKYTTADATIDVGESQDFARVGHVWFNMTYPTNAGGYQEYYDDWNYDAVTNINYNQLYAPGWPLIWIGAITDTATEPGDTIVDNRAWTSSGGGSSHFDFDFFLTSTNRDRTGDWSYSYKIISTGTNDFDVAGAPPVLSMYIESGGLDEYIYGAASDPLIWNTETNYVRLTSIPEQYTINGYASSVTGLIDVGTITGEFSFVETYIGARVDANRSYTFLYTSTNATGNFRPLITNYNSGRQLYVYGDYPNTYMRSLYSDGTIQDSFAWDVPTNLPPLVLTNYFPVGSEEVAGYLVHTNDTFTMSSGAAAESIPFEGTGEIQTGWGASKGVWTVNWFVTNGFTIQ